MTRMKNLTALFGAVLLVAAGSSMAKGQEKQLKENQAACTHFNEMQTAVQDARNIGPQSTVGELKSATNNIQKHFQAFEKSASKAAKPETKNLKASVEQLRKDARKVPNSATLEQARAQLEPDIQQVHMASQQLMTKLNCGMGGAGQQGMEQQQYPSQGGTQQGMENQPSEQGTGGAQQQGMEQQYPSQGGTQQGMENEPSEQGTGTQQGMENLPSDQGTGGAQQQGQQPSDQTQQNPQDQNQPSSTY